MYRRDRDVIPVTFANGASLSGELNVAGRQIVGLVMPAAWTAAAISFQAALANGTTFAQVVEPAAGAEITIVAAAAVVDRYIAVPTTLPVGLGRIKLVSGTTAAQVAQGGIRIIGVVVLS